MTVLCTAAGFSASVSSGHEPDGPLALDMQPAPHASTDLKV